VRLLYNGADVTDRVEIRAAQYIDRAGGLADRLDLAFNDAEEIAWAHWPIAFDDTVAIARGALFTGVMYVDSVRQARGTVELGAVSVSPELRSAGFGAWESIRLHELLRRFADKYALRLRLIGVPDALYPRIVQRGEPDMEWLAFRLSLERCAAKLTGDALAAYFEPEAEAREPQIELSLADCPGYAYRASQYERCAGVILDSGAISYAFRAPGVPSGRVIREANIPALSIAEAERYAMGLARAANKRAEILAVPMALRPELAAGQTVNVASVSDRLRGVWFIDQVRHDIPGERTTASLRRPLKGY